MIFSLVHNPAPGNGAIQLKSKPAARKTGIALNPIKKAKNAPF
jgi:hypothetical protein